VTPGSRLDRADSGMADARRARAGTGWARTDAERTKRLGAGRWRLLGIDAPGDGAEELGGEEAPQQAVGAEAGVAGHGDGEDPLLRPRDGARALVSKRYVPLNDSNLSTMS
jgi:hypothetical protein